MSTNTRKATLNHVLDILDFDQDAKDVMLGSGIKSLSLLATCSEDELTVIQENHPDVMVFGHIKSINMFKLWCKQYADKNPTSSFTAINWKEDFIHEIWDDFLMQQSKHSLEEANPSSQSSEVSSITGKFKDASLSNIKIDIKSYPSFDGKLTSWRSFKQRFQALSSMHGFAYLLDKEFEAPTDESSEDFDKYEQKNRVFSSK